MIKSWFLTAAVFLAGAAPDCALAQDWYLSPQIGVGYNTKQGTNVIFGLDYKTLLDNGWSTGLGGYFSYGEHPTRDREFGVGPFVGYSQQIEDDLYGHVREDIDYIDLRNPVAEPEAGEPEFVSESGIASITSLAASYYFTENFGVMAGVRLVLGLTNSRLSSGRSGLQFGLLISL